MDLDNPIKEFGWGLWLRASSRSSVYSDNQQWLRDATSASLDGTTTRSDVRSKNKEEFGTGVQPGDASGLAAVEEEFVVDGKKRARVEDVSLASVQAMVGVGVTNLSYTKTTLPAVGFNKIFFFHVKKKVLLCYELL